MSFIIKGLGSYLPGNPVSNQALSKFVDTNDEWVRTRTGITQRYFSEEISDSEMSYQASLRAIEDAGISHTEIDYVIVCTTSPDMTFPSTACYLQGRLNIGSNTPALDLNAACAGFIYGLHFANMIFKTENVKNILLVGIDKLSHSLDFSDRSTAVLFGDGAGAAILRRKDDNFFASKIYSDGSFVRELYAKQEGEKRIIHMNGAEIYRHGIAKMQMACENILKENNLTIQDIDFFVPHQANIRIINALGERLGIEDKKIVKTVSIHANTSAATIPLALDFYKKHNNISPGSLCLMSAVGAGLAWGSAIIRF